MMFFLYKSMTDYKKQDTNVEMYFPVPRDCRKIFMTKKINKPDSGESHPYITDSCFTYVVYPDVDAYRLKVVKRL